MTQKLPFYRNKDKSGTLPTGLSWNLSSLLNTDPIDDETPPAILWVEGREISALPGDQEITLSWEWGDELCDDTVKATVQARAGESEASIRVVSLGSNGEPGAEKYDPIGGVMYLALQIKLGPGERLEQSMSTVTVKAQDDYAYTGSPASFTATWNLGNASEWWELINPGTAQAQWVAASVAPNNATGNRDGSLARIYCSMKEWDTPFTPSLPFTPPMGHNGEHTLKIVQVNGVDGDELSFQHYVVPTWQTAYAKAVPAQKAVVRNLVVTNVKTSNGTEDYFKYDPDPESPYNRPTISFTIEDDGAQHEYDAYIMMWPTSVTGSLFQGLTTADAIAWTEDLHLNAGEYSKTWDGSLIPDTWAGYAADESPWSTYAFEVMVFEYPDQNATRNQYIDWFYLRWPYCLQDYTHGVSVEEVTQLLSYHSFDYETGEDLGYVDLTTIVGHNLRCCFKLNDKCQSAAYGNYVAPSEIVLTPIDGNLNEHTFLTPFFDPIVPGIEYTDENNQGILAYSSDGYTDFADWRIIWTGIDNCWVGYRRDHLPSKMVAFNKRVFESLPKKCIEPFSDHYIPTHKTQRYYYWTLGLQDPSEKIKSNRFWNFDWGNFKYDPDLKATFEDRALWSVFRTANETDFINSIVPDGAKAFQHYASHTGKELSINIEKAWKQIHSLQEECSAEIICAQNFAEELATRANDPLNFSMTGHVNTARGYGTLCGKKTQGYNWQYALGDFQVLSQATGVRISTLYCQMSIKFICKDLYNFNPGATANILSDNILV